MPSHPTAVDPPPELTWIDDETLQVGATTYSVFFGNPGAKHLRIFKPRLLINAYEPIIQEFQRSTIVELGIYRGGSTAYLAQRTRAERLVALDRSSERVPELDTFLAEADLLDQVRLHYGVDQGDRERVRSIVEHDLDGRPLDLVLDDASHRYGPTVASFETLFPLLRPAGLYVIEDWNPETWLIASLRNALRAQDADALPTIETRLVREVPDDDQPVGDGFVRWCASALVDTGHVDHDLVRPWFDALGRHDAPPGIDAVRDLIAAAAAAVGAEQRGEPGRSAPTLPTLAVELLLAMVGVHPAIGSLTITPFWLEVRRGFTDEPTIAIDDLRTDHLGLLDDARWRTRSR